MIECQRVAFGRAQLAGKGLFKLGESGQAAPVHLYRRDPRSRTQQSPGQPAGTGADFQHGLVVQVAGNVCDAVKQLLVEEEVLSERFGRAQPVAGDDFPEGA